MERSTQPADDGFSAVEWASSSLTLSFLEPLSVGGLLPDLTCDGSGVGRRLELGDVAFSSDSDRLAPSSDGGVGGE